MANSRSAKKRIRQNETRRLRNVHVRSKMRTQIRGFESAIDAGDLAAAEEKYRLVESLLDRAVIKGVIPRKRASRKASRLAKRLHKVRSEAS